SSPAHFVADVKISGALEAHARQCEFTVGAVDAELALDVDREMLLSAVGNLLQNAFKFTQRHTEVSLNAYGAADRIRIDVEDHCGGLPEGALPGSTLTRFLRQAHSTSVYLGAMDDT